MGRNEGLVEIDRKDTIPPVKYNLKLLSINGQKDNSTVDLTKDMVLEVDVPAGLEGRLADVSLMAAVIGIRSFINAGSYPLARRMVIPAAGFRHTNQPVSASFNPSFLQISFMEVVPVSNQSGPLTEVTCINVSQDGLYFNAPAGAKQAKNLTAKSSVKGSDDKIGYELTKGTAYFSRPVSELKKIGVGSFVMTGDTYSRTENKYKTETATTVTTITTTRTVRFPVLVPAETETVMTPTLSFELSGAQNNFIGSTSFFKGSVSGPGVDYNKLAKDGLTLDELTQLTRQSDLVAGLRRGLHELIAQEKAAPDYETYWAPRRGHK